MIRPTPSRQPASPAVDAARRRVLEYLDRAGPVAAAEIPGHWPVTRHHVRVVIGDLASDGLVASDRPQGAGIPRVSLTPAGREALGRR